MTKERTKRRERNVATGERRNEHRSGVNARMCAKMREEREKSERRWLPAGLFSLITGYKLFKDLRRPLLLVGKSVVLTDAAQEIFFDIKEQTSSDSHTQPDCGCLYFVVI